MQIPPTAERLGPAFQPNMPAYQQGEGTTTQNCSCVWCSDVQRTQVHPTTEHPVEQQVPRPFSVSGLNNDNVVPTLIRSPYLNQGQNVNTRVETAADVPDRTWASYVPPQAAVRANTFPCVLVAEVLT